MKKVLPSAKKRNNGVSRQKIVENQKIGPYQKQKFLQTQMDDMFAQMANILNSMNHIVKQRVFCNILREHLYEAKRNMVHLIRKSCQILGGKKVIDQKNQQISKRQELNYYQMRLRYFLKFKQWVQQLQRMQKLGIQNWHKQAGSAQFPQLYCFILDEHGLQKFLTTSLTIKQAISLYVKYVYIFKDQQKQLIQIHLTKIQIFLSQIEALSKLQAWPQDNMVLFVKVNYGGKQNIKELLAQPKVYQMCEQYIKWRIYLASR